jgi:hypothetical protein
MMALSRCAPKIRGLAVNDPNDPKAYVVVNKVVIEFLDARLQKSQGEEMKASLAMLLKTNGGRMSVLTSLAMLLKKHGLFCLSRDVNEKRWGYAIKSYELRTAAVRGCGDLRIRI